MRKAIDSLPDDVATLKAMVVATRDERDAAQVKACNAEAELPQRRDAEDGQRSKAAPRCCTGSDHDHADVLRGCHHGSGARPKLRP